MHQQSEHQEHQISTSDPQSSTSRSTYQSFSIPQEPTGIPNDDLSFSEYFQDCSNGLPPIPPMDFFFESDTPTHDVSIELGGNNASKPQQGSEMYSEPANLDPSLETSALTKCGCVQSALLSLSSLYAVVRRNSAASLDSIFATARNGLFTCETLTLAKCSSCQPGFATTLLLLCVGILQQVHNAYELVGNPAKLSAEPVHGKKLALSIKIGEMEFVDTGNSSGIMQAILKMEKARAERVCVELEKMATDAQNGDLSGVRKEGMMVCDGLIGLLGVFRERFTTKET